MSRKLRVFVTATALFLGLFGSAVAFAGTSSAAQTAHPAAISATAGSVVIDQTTGNIHPNAMISCSWQFASAAELDYVCTNFSGQVVAIVATCGDGSTITVPIPSPGTFGGRIVCPSGILAVRVVTFGWLSS